jgi:uncharacterized protein YjdB
MKKKSLSILIAVAMATTTILPAASVFADTTAATVTSAPASSYGVSYDAHVQHIGWQASVKDGADAGTVGEGLRLEALKVNLDGALPAGAHIEYSAHVQNIGWMANVEDGVEAGTDGQSKRVEAIKINLVGLPGYSVQYRVQGQNYGWQDWKADGDIAGTTGQSLRVETIEVKIVKTAAENAAEVTAINAVSAAQATPTAATIATATAAVSAVQDATENASLTALIKAINVPLAVSSVSAINGAQLVVNFDKAIDPSTVIDTDAVTGVKTLKAGVVTDTSVSGTGTLATIDHTSLASLSADGKTLTITAANNAGSFSNCKYAVNVADTVATTSGETCAAYESGLLSTPDTTAPTLVSTSNVNASEVRATFSEPLANAGSWTFKLADGTDVTSDVTPDYTNINAGYVGLTFTGAGITAGQVVTATEIGAEDYAGNLVNPNPVTFTATKGAEDGVAPTVSSITPTGLNSSTIKFSEQVEGLTAADITVAGSTGVTGLTQNATDPTEYTITTTNETAGLHTVGIVNTASPITNLSGQPFVASSQVVNFTEVAPSLVSSNVQKDTLGNQWLYLTFNKAVARAGVTDATLAATEVKDYVTTTGTIDLSSAVAVDTTDMQYRVQLSNATFKPTSGTAVALDATGSYAVTLTGGFEDTDSDILGTTSLSFVRGTDTLTTAQTVTGVVDQTPGNGTSQVKVSFGQDVDAASASNASNYSISGATISAATVKAGDPQSVYLTLAAGSNALTGTRAVTVNGVETAAGVAMASAYTGTVALTENVAPTITAAKLTDVGTATSTITLTYSKAVANATANDFDIYVGGTKLTTATNAIVAAPGSTTGTITLSIVLTPAQQASGIVVEPSSTNPITVNDLDGNALNFTSIGVN